VREIKEKVREEMDDAKSTIEVANASEVLKGERCIIKLVK